MTASSCPGRDLQADTVERGTAFVHHPQCLGTQQQTRACLGLPSLGATADLLASGTTSGRTS